MNKIIGCLCGALALSLVLAGCGGSSPEDLADKAIKLQILATESAWTPEKREELVKKYKSCTEDDRVKLGEAMDCHIEALKAKGKERDEKSKKCDEQTQKVMQALSQACKDAIK